MASDSESRPSGVFSDDPRDTTGDEYGRVVFAGQVSRLLNRISREHSSSVVALVGPWGCGKSSVLNMVREKLATTEESWETTNFSPWFFEDVDSLLTKYFAQLTSLLPNDPSRSTRRRVASFMLSMAPLGSVSALAGLDLEKPIQTVGEKLDGDRSVEATRDELSAELEKLPYKILFVIDDLDRLQPGEILQVLKLIRLIGRLPNIYYLLAFDERSVLDSLKGTPLANGSDARASRYLEKMVQVRLDVPVLNERQRRDAFFGKLHDLLQLKSRAASEADMARIRFAYESYFQYGFHVPRAINRFFAQAHAFFEEVSKEINSADYLILSYIRAFYGSVFTLLPRWKKELIGDTGAKPAVEGDAGPETIWRRRLLQSGVPADEVRDLYDLLSSLFPPIAASEAGRRSPSPSLLRKAQRVGAPEYFDRYFQQSVPDHEIPDEIVFACMRHFVGGEPEHTGSCHLMEQVRLDPLEAFIKIEHSLSLASIEDASPLLALFVSEYHLHTSSDVNEYTSAIQSCIQQAIVELFKLKNAGQSASLPHDAAALFRLDSSGELCGEVLRKLESQTRLAWLPTFRKLVLRKLKQTVASWPQLRVKNAHSHRELVLLSFMSQPEEIRSLMQHKISSGLWELTEALAFVTLTALQLHYPDGDEPKKLSAYFNTLGERDLERSIGGLYAVTVAGELLDRSFPEPSSFAETPFEPENATEYVLSCLEILRSRLTAD